MNPIVIEIQKNDKDHIVYFVARDPRSGLILGCGSDAISLCQYINSLTKNSD